jgi:basic membrane protein A and related proteins
MGKFKQFPNSFIRRVIRLVLAVAILILLAAPLAGCSQFNLSSTSQQSILNVAMLLGTGGLGDRSFNDSAYAGLLEAQKKYNIRFETVDPAGKEANLQSLRSFARNKYDLIIGVGFEHLEVVQAVAGEFPAVKFGAIDFELTADNVASIVYREQEGDFLMGVLAAMLTKTKTVGVIGGMDIPAIRRIQSGFKQGAAYQDSNVKVISGNAGTFSDPAAGQKLALEQYAAGADIIHNAASKTGLGIIQAAKDTGKLTTGTSGDQRYLAPDNVVGNRPKRVDTAVLLLIDEIKNGKFKAGIRSLGLKENGISLGPFNEIIVNKTVLARLEDLKGKIVSGQIVVKAE